MRGCNGRSAHNTGVLSKIQTYLVMRPIMRPVLWKMNLGFVYGRTVTGTGSVCTINDQVAQNTGSAFNAMDTTVMIGLYWDNANIDGYAYIKQPVSNRIVDEDIRLGGSPTFFRPDYGLGGILLKCEPGQSFGAQLFINMFIPTNQTGTFKVVNFTTYEEHNGTFSITA